LLLACIASGVFLVLDWDVVDREDALFSTVVLPMGMSYATIGALIATRFRRDPIGWLLCVMSLSLELSRLGSQYASHGLRVGGEPLPGATAVARVATWLWIPAATPVGLLLPLSGWSNTIALLASSGMGHLLCNRGMDRCRDPLPKPH